MSKSCLKFVLAFFLGTLSFLSLSTPIYAARTITSATLNGSSSVTVAPSASITAVVNVTNDSGSDWQGTSWTVDGSTTCVDTINHNGTGSYSESFAITAPAGIGVYDASFVAYSNNLCTLGASNTYTLTGGITVSSSTPTPTPSGATPTPTSAGATTTPTSSSTTTIRPSVTLSSQGSMFGGTASISQGVIDAVEFSLNDGKIWSQATPKDGKFDEISEDYTFSAQTALTLGDHKIIVRAKSLAGAYTESANYATLTFTVSPPKVTLNTFSPNPTKDQTPTISGVASSSFAQISSVQISLDEGRTWFSANLSGTKFSLTTKTLEDGNYPVKARAFDVAENAGESETQTLIIDTIPPVIGGGITALGPQILIPDESGVVRTVAEAENTIIMSMRGGVTKATLDVQDEAFDLTPIVGTNLWTGKIVFTKEGEKPAEITAVDGAGNTTTRELNPFLIEETGKVVNIKDNLPVKNAQVSLFMFEVVSKSWTLWDGASFGQKNPQDTAESGIYNYIVPPGRYYLEAKAPGYRTKRSEIFDSEKTNVLTATFPLSPKPKITLQLPLLGEVNFVLPIPYPAQTLGKSELFREIQTKASLKFGLKKGTSLPTFSLPDPAGKVIDSSALKGKPLVLTFLSIWAPPSIEQALILHATSQVLNENQSLLAIFSQDSPGEVETFMNHGNYNFGALIDKDGATSTKCQVSTLPQHIFVNSKGVISNTFTGVLTKEELLEKLNQLD